MDGLQSNHEIPNLQITKVAQLFSIQTTTKTLGWLSKFKGDIFFFLRLQVQMNQRRSQKQRKRKNPDGVRKRQSGYSVGEWTTVIMCSRGDTYSKGPTEGWHPKIISMTAKDQLFHPLSSGLKKFGDTWMCECVFFPVNMKVLVQEDFVRLEKSYSICGSNDALHARSRTPRENKKKVSSDTRACTSKYRIIFTVLDWS